MSPFVTGGPLNPDLHRDVFVDRPQLLRILTHVENKDKYIALKGPRQTGKTTLLFQALAELRRQGYGGAYVTLEKMFKLSQDKFYQKLCGLLWRELGETPADGGVSPIQGVCGRDMMHDKISDEDGFTEYLLWLAKHTPQARRLVIVLDEVGGVPDEISVVFFSNLREFFTNGRKDARAPNRKVMFIFAGALDLEVLMRGRNSPVRNICDTMSLDDFSPEDVGRLASDLTGFPDGSAAAIAGHVYEWTGGHPYLTQRIYELIDESDSCRRDGAAKLGANIDALVRSQIIWGDDVNLGHVMDCINGTPNYSNAVFNVLRKEPRLSVPRVNDLLSIGVLKRRPDQHLTIRNKIYKERLDAYFDAKEGDTVEAGEGVRG